MLLGSACFFISQQNNQVKLGTWQKTNLARILLTKDSSGEKDSKKVHQKLPEVMQMHPLPFIPPFIITVQFPDRFI